KETLKEVKADGKLFSQILKEESKKSKIERRESENLNEVGEKKALEEDKKETQEKKDPPPRIGLAKKDLELSPLLNYLYSLVYKNPDTLSLADKQALNLDNITNQVGIKEFQKMLSQKGINLKDLSYSQIAELTKRNTRPQMTAFLDEIIKKGTLNEAFIQDKMKIKDSQVENLETAPFNKVKLPESVKKEEVLEQMLEKITLSNLEGKNEINIKLNPEYLGGVKLKIQTQGKQVKAEFETTSRLTKKIIQENLEELRQGLKEQGLILEDLEIKIVEV
ncbi:MAG: flagellar hook-length control protein FliK, partial [Armatimonadetes bacterium]|nr:flagellar hook-length control protein FliK [Armatimonadota bacterium]